MIDFTATFIYFFAVLDPIGTVPVFLAVTSGRARSSRRRVAFTATVISAAILVFFVVAGELILTAMAIRLSAFQIAGGIVLFLFALTMIFGESKPEEEMRLAESDGETAVFPLAVPSIAGPGSMLAAVLLTENARYTVLEQAQTTLVMLSVLLITLVFMLGAEGIHRVIGSTGASVASRVMGMILAAVATSSVLDGIRLYFAL